MYRKFKHRFRPLIDYCHICTPYNIIKQLRFLQLLLPEEQETQNINRQHEQKTEPKVGIGQLLRDVTRIQAGEHVARSQFVGCRTTSKNGCNGSDDLCRDKGECDVETCECVEENHPEAYVLVSGRRALDKGTFTYRLLG